MIHYTALFALLAVSSVSGTFLGLGNSPVAPAPGLALNLPPFQPLSVGLGLPLNQQRKLPTHI